MRAFALSLLLLAACAHDDKPPQTSPDVAADPSIAASATATPNASTTSADAGHSACDAVRCRGGMVCKMVDDKPTCVAAP